MHIKVVNVIAFTGSMGSGKSTICNIIKSTYPPVKVQKFAQPLYDIQDYIYARCKLPAPETKDRKLLQWIGTEWGRDTQSKTLWVDLWKQEIKRITHMHPETLILCDDVRFEEEAQAVQDVGGLIVKVEATPAIRKKRIELSGTSHASERGIPDAYIDAVITNNGSLKLLEAQVGYFMDGSLYDDFQA